MSKIPISIRQLANYGLDYVGLISSSGPRSRPVKTDKIDVNLLPISELIFENDMASITLSLVISLDSHFDPNTPEDDKSE